MSRLMIIAEHDGKQVSPNTAKCVTCASQMTDSIDVVVFSNGAKTVSTQAAALTGVSRVISVNASEFDHPLAAVLAPQVVALAGDYSHVLAPSSSFGKDLLPRVAALMGVTQISDLMSVEGDHRYTRPIYAGNVVLTVEANRDEPLIATVRVASFQAAGNDGSASIAQADPQPISGSHTRFVSLERGNSERPDLQSAARVISGGRGVGSAENFSIIYSLADRMNAAVGASRAAVDAGFVPNDMQVGQTGKIIAPDLYVAIGISGAIQHLTGIKDAGTIVAINKDPDAPIFEVADIGLVADLFTALPELEELV